MMQIEKVLYTAKTHTTGGRDGAARSLGRPLESSCRLPALRAAAPIRSNCSPPVGRPVSSGALGLAAAKMKVALPADRAIDAEVDLGTTDGGLLPPRPSQRQPAGFGPRGRPGPGGRRAPVVPVFQGHARQHRRRDQLV